MKFTREDWSHLLTQLQQEDRERLGNPPTYEEAEALLAGELPAEEAERVRRLLIAYPDMVRAVVNEFPGDDAKPGDPDYVSDDEMQQEWTRLRKRIRRSATRKPSPMPIFEVVLTLGVCALFLFALVWHLVTKRPAPEEAHIEAAARLTAIVAKVLPSWHVAALAAGPQCDVLLFDANPGDLSPDQRPILDDAVIEALHYGTGKLKVTEGGVMQFARDERFSGVVYMDGNGQRWISGKVTPRWERVWGVAALDRRDGDKLGRMMVCK